MSSWQNEPVLKGLSFRVRPGETLAVVGHTGAGKSTLANLLLRFYDIDRGAVRVDGVDVREWDLARLRRSVAMVLQDVFLFSGSVAANIRLGEEAIDDERVRWAAGEVHALAHRLSTIQKADRILVLHKGEVREYGTHQELLALRGIYYRLYLLQYKDQELKPVSASGKGRVPPAGALELQR